jgi:hypothetical protein
MGKEANTSSDKPVAKLHFQLSSTCRKWARIVLICIPVIAVAIAIVMLTLPFHWKLIGLAAFIIISGTALSLLFEEWKERNWRKWLRAVFIGIILAVGALLTTLGWNEQDNYLDDRALLFAAAMEWKQNDMRNVEIEKTLSLIRDDDYKTIHFFTFPTNRELTRAIDITQLERWQIQQSPLDFAIFEYTNRIDLLCTRLYAANNSVGNPIKAYRKLIDGIFGKGDAYPEYLKYHRYVEKILRSKHLGLLERVDWLQRKMIDRRKERAYEIAKPADPNDKPVEPNN